jgi:hypothetical protein
MDCAGQIAYPGIALCALDRIVRNQTRIKIPFCEKEEYRQQPGNRFAIHDEYGHTAEPVDLEILLRCSPARVSIACMATGASTSFNTA